MIASATAIAGTAFGVLGTLLAVPTRVTAGVLIDELWFRRLEGSEGYPGAESEGTG